VGFSVADRELILTTALGFHRVIASFRLHLKIVFLGDSRNPGWII